MASAAQPQNAALTVYPEISVKVDFEPSVQIQIDLHITLEQLKDLFHDLFMIEPQNQRLIHKGKPLKRADASLLELQICANDTIYLINTGQKQDAANTNAASANTTLSSKTKNTDPFGTLSDGPNNDELFDGGGGFGGTSGDAMPAYMKSLMKSSFFKEMLSQPEVMENMLLNDPRIKSLVEKNPDMKKVFTNPESMKEMIEMMTNPDYQKHVQKSVDRALINLNAAPGGFDALKHVYTMQKPLFEEKAPPSIPSAAVYDTHDGSSASGIRRPRFADDPLPNPWRPAAKTPKHATGSSSQPPIGAYFDEGDAASRLSLDKNLLSGGLFSSNPFAKFGAAAPPVPRTQSQMPPSAETFAASHDHNEDESLFAATLDDLEDMGFLDRDRNLAALLRAHGNKDMAIDILLDEMEMENESSSAQ